jgi:hypothetical protein
MKKTIYINNVPYAVVETYAAVARLCRLLQATGR